MYTGERRRDEREDYVSLVDDKDCKFLPQFADWLKFWNENVEKKNGLNNETFAAAHQTCMALYDSALSPSTKRI